MNLQFTWLAIETMASTDSDIIVLFLDDSTISNHYYSVFHHPNNRIFEPGEDECSRLVEPLPWPMNNPTGLTIHWIPRLGQFTLPSIPSRSGNFKKNVELFRIRLDYLGMDQYLLIPFLVGWTSIYQLFWCSPGVQGFDTLPFVSFKELAIACWGVTASKSRQVETGPTGQCPGVKPFWRRGGGRRNQGGWRGLCRQQMDRPANDAADFAGKKKMWCTVSREFVDWLEHHWARQRNPEFNPEF